MQSTLKNPDSRSLPIGWAEHFDSERRIWYYVDVNIQPPRATFVHPCDADGKHPASAPAKYREYGTIARIPQRPVGPRTNASASLNAAGQRARRATVAQQLYASSLSSSGSRECPMVSDQASLRQPSASSSTTSDDVAFTSRSNTPYTSKSSGVSSTSSSSLTNLDTHHPRNFFDCTRLAPGIRRMTVNGPQPSHPSSSGSAHQESVTYGARALYHPSVNNTPSPIPLQGPPDNNHRRVTLPTSSNQKSSVMSRSNEPSSARSNDFPQSSTAILSASRLNANPTFPGPKLYSAITDDNLMVMPQYTGSLAPSGSPVALDISSLQDEQPVASNSLQEIRNISRPTDTAILQPKPIRPMKGISLNLQVQVAAMSETQDKDEGPQSYSKSKRKSQLLKNLGFGIGKGKAKMVMDSCEGDQADGHGSKDESFVLVNTSM